MIFIYLILIKFFFLFVLIKLEIRLILYTPLHFAAEKGFVEIVKLLLRQPLIKINTKTVLFIELINRIYSYQLITFSYLFLKNRVLFFCYSHAIFFCIKLILPHFIWQFKIIMHQLLLFYYKNPV